MLTNKDKKFYEKVAREKGNLGKNKYLFCDLHSQRFCCKVSKRSLVFQDDSYLSRDS